MNYKLKVMLGFIASFMCIYFTLFASIHLNAFSIDFYKQQEQKLNISESMDVSSEDYRKSMNILLDYLQENRDDINVRVTYKGEEISMFNEKEYTHMIDVRNLYRSAGLVAKCCGVLGIILLLIIFFDNKGQFLEIFATSYLRMMMVSLVFITFIVLYAITDFTDFWTRFHHVFFNNDLWLLDARTDFMIRMLPQELFFAMIVRIVGAFAIVYLGLALYSVWYLKKHKKLHQVLFL